MARAKAFLTEQMSTREGERLAQGHPAQAVPSGNWDPAVWARRALRTSSRTSRWEQRIHPSVSDKKYEAQQGDCSS